MVVVDDDSEYVNTPMTATSTFDVVVLMSPVVMQSK